MIKLKELTLILLSAFALAFTFAYIDILLFFEAFLIFIIVIFFNFAGKKIAAHFLNSEIEIDLWGLQRFGFREKSQFKKPIPLGIILSMLLPFISEGILKWFAVLETEVIGTEARAAKKAGLYTFYEVTEFDLGLILSAGILVNLFLALLGYIFDAGFLAQLSVFYAFFNLIPISKLDGTKILFGSRVIWFVLAVLASIGTFYSLVL